MTATRFPKIDSAGLREAARLGHASVSSVVRFSRQPDDPGPSHGICPSCGCRCKRDPDAVALSLLKRNAGRVHKTIIASAIGWSVAKLERFARRNKIDLVCREREVEPTGA